MTNPARRRATFVVALLVSGCGLDEAGVPAVDAGFNASDGELASDAGSGLDAGPAADGMIEVDANGGDAQTCGSSATCAAPDVPAGWSPIAFAASRANPCPSNFTPSDSIENPTNTGGACACSCGPTEITTAPSCASGSLTLSHSGNTSCGSTSTAFAVTDGNCKPTANFGVDKNISGTALAMTAGVCTGKTVQNLAVVTSVGARSCAPPSACAGDVCGGIVPAGYRACITSPTAATCPAGSVFSEAHTVGDAVTLACSACATCAVTATCATTPTIKFYSDNACVNALSGTVALDGVCNSSGLPSMQNSQSFVYTSVISPVTCASSGTTATVGLSGGRIVCCR